MKKTIYFCLCALFFLGVSSSRSAAQVIASYTDLPDCAVFHDSLSVTETGYVSGDSIIIEYGDGTVDTLPPSWTSGGSAYYWPYHVRTSFGTFTRKIVLVSGGVRVDSVIYSITFNPCELFHLRLYNDVNSNCVFDAGEWQINTGPASVKIDSAGVPVDTITSNSAVWYKARGAIGTVYTFTVLTPPPGFMVTCPSTGVLSRTITTGWGYYVDSVGFECDPSACLDNAISGTFGAAVPGGIANMWLTTTSCTPVTQTVTLVFSTKYTLSSVSGASYTVSGNVATLTTTVSSVSPKYVTANLNPVGTLTMGDTTHCTFSIPITGDCNITNNSVFIVDTITASLDPNDKAVKPNGPITAGTQLEYLIRFENIGNGPAENVHILDTLSDHLDINTIKQISSSAACNMMFIQWAGHNIVKFDFPGINLADSSHKPDNQGYVSFSIKAKTTLVPGTHIDNKAGIYFDTNPVVMTNNVRSSIPVPSHVASISSNVVEVYPNPVNDVLTITTIDGRYNSLTVTNMLGQTILSSRFDNTQTTVNVKALPAGIYYVTLRGESGVKVQKFEKL